MLEKGYSLHPAASIRFTTEGRHHFFGYYDKTPWNADGTRMIAVETDLLSRLPSPSDIAAVMILDIPTGKYRKLCDTRAWNFQQGCMAQWMGPDFNRRVIMNDRRSGRLQCVIIDVATGAEVTHPYPIYAVHPSGAVALSVNFDLLDRVREGYGYKGGMLVETAIASASEGVRALDLVTGEARLIVSLRDLYLLAPAALRDQGQHWVDHLAFNPSGSRFVFYHRFLLRDGRMYSRLYTAKTDGSGLFMLLDSGMASHSGWMNDSDLCVWSRSVGLAASMFRMTWLRRLVVPVYHMAARTAHARQRLTGDGYRRLRDETSQSEPIGAGVLTEDGHCSFSSDSRWMLTDTYAGADLRRRLILFHLRTGTAVEVGSFYALPDPRSGTTAEFATSNVRCDLHPRFNRDGRQICIDSVHTGTRQMTVIDVSSIVDARNEAAA
jgi:hypothetical protein